MPPRSAPTSAVALFAVEGNKAHARADVLAVEEPLEIRLRTAASPVAQTLSVTMRTPGKDTREDEELALGFLFTEGILRRRDEIAAILHLEPNVLCLMSAPDASLDLARPGLERHFYTTSACGICGKSSLTALAATPAAPLRPAFDGPRLELPIIHELSATLRKAQHTFGSTGGLHAAGLFDAQGKLLLLREDVGRHNAVDKLIGAALDLGQLPLFDAIILVSGRASFELVQKARMAGVPIFVAVGAPSSLAVDAARESAMTLIGFARDGRCNVYSAPERLALKPKPAQES